MNRQLQSQLLDQILGLFSKKSAAVDKLTELLNVGKDAVYRRLRGDTLLTPDEIGLLAKEYNISLDAIVFGDTDSVFFTFNPFYQQIKTTEDYLMGIRQILNQAVALPEVKVYYASSEIPLFYYCFFPELISFKLYVWGRTIWDLDYLRGQNYRHELIGPHALRLAKELLGIYKELDTTELWSLNIFDNTLSQIEYHANSGLFEEPETALQLCDCLDQLTRHMYQMAENGRKFHLNANPQTGNPFQLYYNEMIYTNNTIFLSSPLTRGVFSTFGNPNFLRSSDPRICDFTEQWFGKIISKSNPISTHGEKARSWFFNGLKKRIDRTRKRIEVQQ